METHIKTDFAIHNPQSTIHNPQSTIHNPQSTIHNPQSTIHNPPLDLQSKINTITAKYDDKQDITISICYLIRDIFLSIHFAIFAYRIKPHFEHYPILWYLGYSGIQGTIWTGLWVLGHECGHGAFAKNKHVNDIFGLVIHSFLLVPYFSWQYTHRKHHKYTNHLTLGETHVPFLKTELPSEKYKEIRNWIGPVYNTLFQSFLKLFLGWPLYLLQNSSGGRIDAQNKLIESPSFFTLSHFNPYSKIFPRKMIPNVFITDIFLFLQLGILYYIDHYYGFGTSFTWYWCPYFVTNAWLVLYTILQHTDKDIPHYGPDDFTWLKGALSTVDRNYPFIIDDMHHFIGSTHVLHHLNAKIPFYYAKQATEELKEVLGDWYRYDETPFLQAFYKAILECNYIEGLTGIQYYKPIIYTK